MLCLKGISIFGRRNRNHILNPRLMRNGKSCSRYFSRSRKVKLEILLLSMGYTLNNLHAKIQNDRMESHLFQIKESV